MRKASGLSPGKTRAGFVCGVLSVLSLGFIAEASALEGNWGSLEVRSATKYRLQWSDSASFGSLPDDKNDQDISELLSADGELKGQKIGFSFLGKYAKDLDGTPEGSVFQDYLDAGSERQRLDIYYAYAEKKDLLPNTTVRLGRQYAYGPETVHYDGISVKADHVLKDWLSVGAFAGGIVQMYSDLKQDTVGGFNAELHPSKELALYLDSVIYQKMSWDGSVYWRPVENIKTSARTAFIDEKAKDFGADFSYTCPFSETTLGLGVYRRFKVAIEDDFLFDYTYSIEDNLKEDVKRFYLGRELGYTDFTVSIDQPIPHQHGLAVFARYTNRQLSNDSNEDLYNTDFDRWTLGFTMQDWLVFHGTRLSVGYSIWNEHRDLIYEAESGSVFADLEQELGEKWAVGAGLYYKEEDVNSRVEGEAASHYYGLLKYKLAKDRWAELKYEHESDDYYKEFGVSSLNTLTATFNIKF